VGRVAPGEEVVPSVVLHGGPMDGFIVLRESAALTEDWFKTWPPAVRREHAPGRYVRRRDRANADWRPV
jgi:hypothetical protein